ncbi:alpha-galactosidase [Clostridium beijerinckii]|uniref:alpha-galactosidase n=1 Tax=Clostridium beijerinckii TaxID=1520 RepID=UPI001493EAC7|nr:alpha-galactosidase [Clostridium beijerinckii]NOW05152.1 alpha-galactosidase [Clostridium beijerinckii]NYC01706.1 alpha-galactosidase [Clostridium beijerinckii]
MAIIFNEKSREFHIYNEQISYIIKILDNNQLGNLYYGKRIHQRESFSYLFEGGMRASTSYVFEGDTYFSMQHTKQEYPSYGTTDFRYPAFEIKQKNGSKITNFEFENFNIFKGKKKLENLPATYVENEKEANTLEITLYDKVIKTRLLLSYTIFEDFPIITRSTKFIYEGKEKVILTKAMSCNIDLPDYDYEMVHLSGAWSRERHVKNKKLEQGIQSIYSLRGASSSEHNPFIALKRPSTTEFEGEVYGFSLVYSGNFLAEVLVDTHDTSRVMLGIHPIMFEWVLNKNESFQTPEVVMVYSDKGMNGMSQVYHKLYRTRLARGYWRDKIRPILINNWEATMFDFDEEIILNIAKTASELGIELFVLDDGWFGSRNNDKAGLGDWYVNTKKLPDGIVGLSKKIENMGMKFGLWFEPEMVNKDSDLYRAHPDWIIHTPNRTTSHSRNQYVLDFTRKEVVNYIYEAMSKILREASISYVKWDMNRYITECYSVVRTEEDQGRVMHEYILGVYSLYEKLTSEFPYILFESCASGGARFDPGILYYAPQGWTSDNTDAVERMKIQYGTSYVYPISCMGAHVSEVPNQQVFRTTPLETRANVAYFGAFGYELDLNHLSEEERAIVKKQVKFMKENRELIQKGTFYRLISPFENKLNSWMVVSEDKSEAIVGYYKILNTANEGFKRIKLQGLDENKKYYINDNKEESFFGDELMFAGIPVRSEDFCEHGGDFTSVIYHLNEINK